MSKLNRNQKAMLFAEGIVERYRARGNQLPHRSKTCRMDPNREQEYKDAAKLNDWKQSLKGNRGTCAVEIRNYLDFHIPNWRVSSRTVRHDSDEENDSTRLKKTLPTTTRSNIEKEVCYAMVSKFSTNKKRDHSVTKQPLQSQHSPISYWNDYQFNYDSTSHNPNPKSCSDKKRKRHNTKLENVSVTEDEEEIRKQIRLDSELLLSLTYSGRHECQNIV